MTKKYHLDDTNYLRFCELIQARTGIRVGESRRRVLAHALKESAESADYADLDQLFSSLWEAQTDSEVWNDLIRKVTIGETYFFRDSEMIDALRRHILPNLRACHRTDRTLRLWSAGCATGEEPYTLAILLRQLFSDIDEWRILILATDINRQALKHAVTGRYRDWSFRETDPAVRDAYFTHDGSTYTLKPVLREMVTFAYHNLAEDNYPLPTNQTDNLDLILCRNVTIYLPILLIHDIANRFYQCLSNGGWLIVGPSETHLEIYRQFRTLSFNGATAYQKVADSPPATGLWSAVPGVSQISPTLIKQSPRVAEPFAPPLLNPTNEIGIIQLPEDETSRTKSKVDLSSSQPECQDSLRVDPERLQSTFSKTRFGIAERVDLCQQGEALMKQHRYDEARQCFLSCLAREPDSIRAAYWMACLEANVGRLEEAQTWAEKALHHDPLLSEIHYKLALIHEAQGELREAVSRLKKVIYLDPNFILAHFGLFHLYQRTANPIEAERHRTVAVHLASKLPPDTVLPGSDDLTAGQLLAMARAFPKNRNAYKNATHPIPTLRGES
jgi:chemotaxis protein methyltransferase CheR